MLSATLIACSAAEAPPAQTRASMQATNAPPSAPATSATAAAAVASDAAAPSPAGVESRTEPLEVPPFEPSLVVTPSDARPGRPLLIVAHGAGGRPEPHCARYAELVRGRGFILCTRGRPTNKHLPPEQRGYFYDGHLELGVELRGALSALRERYGAWLDGSNSVYAGYSQGATMGILYLQQGGATDTDTARILLVEGGSAEWTIGLSAKLAKEGVDKVAIVCGQASCRRAANKSKPWIEQGGLSLSSTYAEGAGHIYDGPMAPLVEQAWSWLIAADPRWQSP